MYTGKSTRKSYVRDKIKILKEFGVIVYKSLETELMNMETTNDIDRRCRSIITNHLDRINEAETSIRVSKKGGVR